MPAFDTPEPITLEIDLGGGGVTGAGVARDVRITASDRRDTVVSVRPSDESQELDVRVAEQTRVERTAAGVLVRAPRQRGLGLFGRPGSIDITIELPAGQTSGARPPPRRSARLAGLGECRIKTGVGDLQLDEAGPADLHTGAGTVEAELIGGPAEVSTGSGRVRLGQVDGPAVIKNSNGDNVIGQVAGDLRVKTSNGQISVDRAAGDVDASTANGNVRIGEVTRGSVTLKTGFGEVEVGISAGTAARLDTYTGFGRVQNELTAADGPGSADEVVEVRARTGYGDIVIRRS